jgi:predicted SAM-dependent methyltransferase
MYRIKSPSRPLFLNIGCGRKYVRGFVNVDGNLFCRKDMWLDLRNRLPFSSESVDAIYCCHVLEHFYPDELRQILRECHRVLRHGAGIRVLVPSLEGAVAAYVQGKTTWFSDFPTSYQSLGGRFSNFLCCDGQHRMAFDFGFMDEVVTASGFKEARVSPPAQSEILPSPLVTQAEDAHEGYIASSLIIEAVKV